MLPHGPPHVQTLGSWRPHSQRLKWIGRPVRFSAADMSGYVSLGSKGAA